MKKIKITDAQAGTRLDIFLTEEIKDVSRSQIQKKIKDENIKINDKAVAPHYKLKLGDIITLNLKKDERKKTAETTEKMKLKITAINFKKMIIADTPDYLIINKPAGLVVHGAEFISETSLADILVKKYPEIKEVGEDPYRPGIVHRLDKEASGLMIIAKNQKFFNYIKKQFQKRSIKKNYTALVFGQIEKQEDEINFPIKRSSTGHKMASIPLTTKNDKSYLEKFPTARQAISKFKILERLINYTLLDVNIETGRTHQIRCHLGAYGHPIVGDYLYSTKKTRDLNKKIDLGRIFLVAHKLSFKDLNKEKQEYSIKLPSELQEFLKKAK